MTKEPTNGELLHAITSVRTDLQQEIRTGLANVNGQMQDVLETIHELATHVDTRFDRVEGRLDRVELDVKTIKSTMVTKAHLDDKLADEGVRYGSLIRQTNEKIGVLADALVVEGSLSSNAAKQVVGSEPFPKR